MRTVATLAGAVDLLAPIHGTSRVLACTRSECFEIDIETGAALHFATFDPKNSYPTGGGGWDDHVFIVESSGNIHERCGHGSSVQALGAPLGPIRGCVVARDSRMMAISTDCTRGGGWARSDVLLVHHIANGCRSNSGSLRYEPPSHDCFEIDDISMSADGSWVGLTGRAIGYSEDGPHRRVFEKACIVSCEWSAPEDQSGIVIEVNDVWTYKAVGRAVALGDADWFVDQHRLPRITSPKQSTMITLPDIEAYPSRLGAIEVTGIVALPGGGFAAIGSSGARQPKMIVDRLLIGHRDEPAETDILLSFDAAPIRAMTAVEGAIVIGHADGRVVAISN